MDGNLSFFMRFRDCPLCSHTPLWAGLCVSVQVFVRGENNPTKPHQQGIERSQTPRNPRRWLRSEASTRLAVGTKAQLLLKDEPRWASPSSRGNELRKKRSCSSFNFPCAPLSLLPVPPAVTYRQRRDMTRVKQTAAEQNTSRRHLQPS